MYASLPMYDWPEVRADFDALWAGIAERLRARGIEAPATLNRTHDLYDGWLRPDLLLSQTCGLPYVRRLQGRVKLVGAVDLGLPDIAPGCYCSRIVVRNADAGHAFGWFRGTRAAINSPESQSGAGSLRHMVLPWLASGRFFGGVLVTGGHVLSIRAVAEGRADLAAIDAFSWALAERFLPEVAGLSVIASTPPTAGLPLITAWDGPVEALSWAVKGALAALSPEQRASVGMLKLMPSRPSDFALITETDAAARRADYCELDQPSA